LPSNDPKILRPSAQILHFWKKIEQKENVPTDQKFRERGVMAPYFHYHNTTDVHSPPWVL